MTYEDDSPHATPKMRLIGIVWAVVGVLAVIVGLLAHWSAVAIFGGMALVAGIVVFGIQVAREQSAQQTARRLAGGPVSPAAAPAPMPAGPSGPATVVDAADGERIYKRRPWLRREAEEEDAERSRDDEPGGEPLADPPSSGRSGSGDAAEGGDDVDDSDDDRYDDRSASEVDDDD